MKVAEYIERETAVRAVMAAKWVDGSDGAMAMEIVATTPAANVAPVVRCKDCVHWDDDPDTYGSDDGPKGKCMKSFETMCADDFCSYGERKENDHEKV